MDLAGLNLFINHTKWTFRSDAAMELLALRSNGTVSTGSGLPLSVYTVGTEDQLPITRLEGHSANQIMITFSGSGKFRQLGQQWIPIKPGTLLYIPSGLPNEYRPASAEPWQVGYVTFIESSAGMMKSWGLGREAFTRHLTDSDCFEALFKQIWLRSGLNYMPWEATSGLLSLIVELLKQMQPGDYSLKHTINGRTIHDHDMVIDSTVRFMHDHLGRPITMTELSAHAGYSSKQLTRLFRKVYDKTPMQYLQAFRLNTANLLLIDNPELTIRQVASSVGMEPVYLTRLFRRTHGCTPSESRRK
jgi:AraC-like DNA-binding protein